eukprot:4667842-Prymnesium_polylepis.6
MVPPIIHGVIHKIAKARPKASRSVERAEECWFGSVALVDDQLVWVGAEHGSATEPERATRPAKVGHRLPRRRVVLGGNLCGHLAP